jgi:hypothetical protein
LSDSPRRLRALYNSVVSDLRGDDGRPGLERGPTIVFVSATILLTLFYYFGKSSAFHTLGLAEWSAARWPDMAPEWQGLLPFLYWGVGALVLRVLAPIAIAKGLLKLRAADLGLQLRGTLKHAPIYLLLYLGMFPVLWWASGQQSFQDTYPLYDAARAGGRLFWAFQFCYWLQFIGVEFFFRGFMLFPLLKRFGHNALLISALPYVMIHFNKPVLETLGALIAGVALGYLAIRARSCVLGIALHVGIAVTMDLMSMARHGEGGSAFWRLLFG